MTIIVEDKRGGMHFLDATTLMRVSHTPQYFSSWSLYGEVGDKSDTDLKIWLVVKRKVHVE
jgi:hypothetical protein